LTEQRYNPFLRKDKNDQGAFMEINRDHIETLYESRFLRCYDLKYAEGSELFDGFELLDREHARKIFSAGRDDHGNFYSLSAWMVLSIYFSLY